VLAFFYKAGVDYVRNVYDVQKKDGNENISDLRRTCSSFKIEGQPLPGIVILVSAMSAAIRKRSKVLF
jgi:hypothetical protein